MPDLSHSAVHKFWHDYQDATIYRVIAFMESQESWTVDGDAGLEKAIQSLGAVLEDMGSIELECHDDIIKLVGAIKTGRGLRLLMALDMAYPGAAAKILMYAEEQTSSKEDMSGMFLQRNIVFERLRLLSRVFEQDRFKIVLKALEEGGYD